MRMLCWFRHNYLYLKCPFTYEWKFVGINTQRIVRTCCHCCKSWYDAEVSPFAGPSRWVPIKDNDPLMPITDTNEEQIGRVLSEHD